jgi:crotonobetainyl-CoA:carnitine CoA-transferase CaiB-like acyl-CoA transferase
MGGPLEGVKVIELGALVAAPLAELHPAGVVA